MMQGKRAVEPGAMFGTLGNASLIESSRAQMKGLSLGDYCSWVISRQQRRSALSHAVEPVVSSSIENRWRS